MWKIEQQRQNKTSNLARHKNKENYRKLILFPVLTNRTSIINGMDSKYWSYREVK